jgi:hypothetical protein
VDAQPQKYYPSNLGLPTPANQFLQEFFVSGKNSDDAMYKLTTLFLKHRAKIVSQTCYTSEDARELTIDAICNLEKIDCTKDDMLLEIRKLSFVKMAETLGMKNRIFSWSLFPFTVMGKVRHVAFPATVIVRISRNLSNSLGTKASAAILEEGRSYGSEVIKLLRAAFPPEATVTTVSENVKGYLRASGWGKFDLRFEPEQGLCETVIVDPPAIDGEASGNDFLLGLVRGIIEGLYGLKTGIVRQSYDSSKRTLSVTLAKENVAQAVAKSDEILEAVKVQEDQKRKKMKEEAEEAKALEELEKVIAEVEDTVKEEEAPKEESKEVLYILDEELETAPSEF